MVVLLQHGGVIPAITFAQMNTRRLGTIVMPLHIEGISVRKRVVSARQCRGSNAVDGDVLMQASVGWLVERTMMRDKEAAPSCGVGVFIVIEEAESLSGK